jgi:hypothetical protein
VNTPKEALIIASVGLATTAVVGTLVGRAIRSWRWPQTTGTILESTVVRLADNDSDGERRRLRYQLDVRFGYSANGQSFTGNRLSFFGASTRHISQADAEAHLRRISRGNAIDVWYDPADPAQAVVDRGIPWGFWAALALGVLFLAGGTLPLLLGRLS